MHTTSRSAPTTGRRPRLRAILRMPLLLGTWAELLWLIMGTPLALACAVILLVGFTVGTALTPAFVGLLVLSGTLLAARRLAAMHRKLAGALLGTEIAMPLPSHLKPGLWNWIKARLSDPVSWRAIAYLLIRLPLAIVNLTVFALAAGFALATLSYPILRLTLAGGALPVFNIRTETWLAANVLALLGLIVLLILPWLAHGLLGTERLLARGLLGPRTLSERVRDLERSRASAVEDADDTLRRIERDLHDGAQAQLVALAMKLGMARDALGDEPDLGQVREIVATAHGQAKQALSELRELARGIRPPALDAGLDVALPTLASSSALDVRTRVQLPQRPPPAIETIMYFSAAELLVNAAKHGAPNGVRSRSTNPMRRYDWSSAMTGPVALAYATAGDSTALPNGSPPSTVGST